MFLSADSGLICWEGGTERVHPGSGAGIKECISVEMHNEDDCLLFLRENTGHTANYFCKLFSGLV